jgi:two-component system response regulator PilR (NtrC family)
VTGHRILVVDDERSMREFLRILLEGDGHRITEADSGEAAFERLAEDEFDLVITDLKMEGLDGLDVVGRTKETQPNAQVIVMTAFATTETAVEAMRRGAYDYVLKPFKVDALRVLIEKAVEKRELLQENISLRRELEDRYAFHRIIGKSAPMQTIYDLIDKVAPTRTNVLISGESGTGKELVARALHYNSPRKDRPFVVVNCGAIPEALMESELFGHERGAFTGAIRSKEGMFEVADGSTMLLDEIGEMPLPLQVKLLRVLQEKKVKRVGGVRETDVDVRIIAATNRRLEREVDEGRFREDLFYRLNVIQIPLPPLRDRRGDIPLLASHFLEVYKEEMGKADIGGFSKEAMHLLLSHGFPGNVRELANLVERAVTLTMSGMIGADVLPLGAGMPSIGRGAISSDMDLPAEGVDLEELVGRIEKGLLLQALRRTGGIRKAAAKLLGISFRSIRYRLEKYGIEESEFIDRRGEV